MIIPDNIKNRILSEKFQYDAIEIYEIGNINKADFHRLRKYFNSIIEPTVEYRIYYNTKNGYKIYKQGEDNNIKYITQKRYFEHSLLMFPIKIFIDKQFPSYIQELTGESKTYIYYYYILNNINILLISSDENTYSFRIFGEKINDSILEIYLNLYLETDILYTAAEKAEILKFLQLSLHNQDIDEALINYKYLQYDNFNSTELLDKYTYTVMHYIDGPRKLLIFHPYGVWLYDVCNKKLNRITNEIYPIFFGVILDGFIIEKHNYGVNHPVTNNWFFAYDCLAYISSNQNGYLGDISIQLQCHKTRLLACQVLADKFKTIFLHINTPIAKELSVSQVFPRIRETLYRQGTLPFKCKGLMFYRAGKYEKNNVLIWEFNPSIKLLAMNCNKELKFYVKDENNLIEFDGTEKYKFNGLNIKNVNNCDIVEYTGKNAYIYSYKMEPDNIETAIEKWNAINDKIDNETMMGNNRKLFDLYHKRLINMLSINSVIIKNNFEELYDNITLVMPKLTKELIEYVKSGVKKISILCIDKIVAHQSFAPKNGIPIKSFATLLEEYYFTEDYIEIVNKETKNKTIEYFFDVEAFINAIKPESYEYYIADNEKLLPEEYLIISQLYSCVIINVV